MKYSSQRYETYAIHFTDGTSKCVYCRKIDLEDEISIAEYRKLDYIQQLNKGDDKVNHRPFTITL